MADTVSGAFWLLAGMAIGSFAGMLLAPVSGEETRHAIAKRAEEGRESLAESGHELLERGIELFERGREFAEEAAEMFERGRKLVENTAAKPSS